MADRVTNRALTRREPFGELAHFSHDMDRFFDFGSGWFDWPHYYWHYHYPTQAEPEYLPPLEIMARGGQTVIKMEVPGVKLEDFDISVADGQLTIKGEKKGEGEFKGEDCYCSERSYGAFRRVLSVPRDMDESKIAASYKDGVLEVVLPKSVERKRRAIKVEAEK